MKLFFVIKIISFLFIIFFISIHGVLAATTADTNYNINVLVIKYFPVTASGSNIDITITGDVGDSYAVIRRHTIDVTDNLIVALEQATRYRGYTDSLARPALKYSVVDMKEYVQAVPSDSVTRRPLYNQILADNSICDYVNNRGVKEVWLWAYQGPNKSDGQPYLAISESKMSGPLGDISNSFRLNDMPQCGKTYRVYTFNYGRGTSEALESWGHQMEAEIDAVNQLFFRNIFQGRNYPQTLGVTGRCGSVHNPPNARFEYDRNNSTSQQSDCLSWNPDSMGILYPISCQNWGCADVSDNNNSSLNYMIWNWQNLPGRNNNKQYQGKSLRNFWDIHGDFDNVMANDKTIFLATDKSVYLDFSTTTTVTPTDAALPAAATATSGGEIANNKLLWIAIISLFLALGAGVIIRNKMAYK